MNKPTIYLNNLAAYVQGRMVGREIELPIKPSELEQIEKQILNDGGGEEITIAHANFPISEYADYKKYNELFLYAEEMGLIDDVLLLVKCYPGHAPEELLAKLENSAYSLIEAEDDENLGYFVVEEGYIPEATTIKSIPEGYIDFEAIGRDFRINNNAQYLEGKCIYLNV